MPARINILERVVQHMGVFVPGLGILPIWNKCVSADKPPDLRIIVPGVVEVEAAVVQPLPGELLVCGHVPGARLAVRAWPMLVQIYHKAANEGRFGEVSASDVMKV